MMGLKKKDTHISGHLYVNMGTPPKRHSPSVYSVAGVVGGLWPFTAVPHPHTLARAYDAHATRAHPSRAAKKKAPEGA